MNGKVISFNPQPGHQPHPHPQPPLAGRIPACTPESLEGHGACSVNSPLASLRERGDGPLAGGEGGTAAAPVARLRVQLDFGTWMGKLERTLRWLDRHQIEVVAFACSTMKGGRVHAAMAGAWRLRRLLDEEANSRGHCHYGDRRIEQWEARDPSTGVLICWEEECRAGGRP